MNAQLSSWPMSIPGSKRRVIERLYPLLPKPDPNGRFVLPFFGTGADAGYLIARGHHVIAGDSQRLLIEWHADAAGCVERAKEWCDRELSDDEPANEAAFYRLRDQHNLDRRAWSLWLLGKLSHSQLVRHNLSGEFNAPFGQVRPLPTAARMQSHAEFIASLDSLTQGDFELTISSAELGDVAYLDPPYLGTFDAYTAERFDHSRLLAACCRLQARRIKFAMSNSPLIVPELGCLAQPFQVNELTRGGTFTSDRKRVSEVLITWEPS